MTDAGGPGRDGRERGDLRIGVVRSYLPGPPPRPTLADSGSKQRAMLPARSVRDHSLGFDAEGWKRFAAGLARVIGRCRDRGYGGWLVAEQDILPRSAARFARAAAEQVTAMITAAGAAR